MTQEMQKQAVGSLAAALSKTMRATRPAMAQVGNFSNAATAAALARAGQAAQLARQSGTVAKQVGSDIALGTRVLGRQAASAATPAINYTRTAVPNTLKFMAGKAPEEKLFQGIRGTTKDVYNIGTLRQIPGLDRPVTAGALPRARLNSPTTYGNFISSARPAVVRPFDKTRQNLAHAWRAAGKGSLGVTGAVTGAALADPYATSAGIANSLYQELHPDFRTPNFRDREYGKQVLNTTANFLPQFLKREYQRRFDPTNFQNTPLENFSDEVFSTSALDVLRSNLDRSLKESPAQRITQRLRGLTPLGMLTNSAINAIAKPLDTNQLNTNVARAALRQNWANQPVNDPMLQYLVQTLPPGVDINELTHARRTPGLDYKPEWYANWFNKNVAGVGPKGVIPYKQLSKFPREDQLPADVRNVVNQDIAKPSYANTVQFLKNLPVFNDYNAPPVSAAEILRRFAR